MFILAIWANDIGPSFILAPPDEHKEINGCLNLTAKSTALLNFHRKLLQMNPQEI